MAGKRNEETGNYEQVPLDTANLYVVTGGSAENKKFFASTPNGELKVGLHNPNVFEVGKEYYVDISLAE